MVSSSPPPFLTSTDAVFLDFDGTLAPIQDNPDTVHLPESGAESLTRIAEMLGGALAIISGRAIEDLGRRIPQNFWRIGGHGLDVCPPGTPALPHDRKAPAALAEALNALSARAPGTRVEDKGAVLALHYRAAPDAGAMLTAAMEEVLSDFPEYRLQSGKMVLEAKPSDANKGRALKKMLDTAPFAGRRPIMVGDDRTDEDAITVALAAGGSAVKVGPGDTAAPYHLPDPAAVWNWINRREAR